MVQRKQSTRKPATTKNPTTKKKPTKKRIVAGKKKIKELYDTLSMRHVFYCCVAGLLLAVVIITANQCSDDDDDISVCYCENATAPIRPKSKLRDISSEQLPHAQANGLKKPIKNSKEFESVIDSLLDNDKLVKIKHTRYYNVRRLTHSYPYLTPEARDLLELIGKRFQTNLKLAGMPRYKYQISSLLRTEEFQKSLTRVNANAIVGVTTHYYGTTFDIAYDKYDYRGESVSDSKIEEILENTLRELREQCRLMIIREKSNKCFHITVVCPKKAV